MLAEIYSYISVYTKNQFTELIANLVEIEGILDGIKDLSSKADGYAMEVEESLRVVEKYIEEQYEKDMMGNEAKYENAMELFEVIERKP